ncbi:hypothetical protein [Microbispora sp. NBRC 16548]|uniref:hypothetical protein n=1 Tax=Microbispora sp. NBRC 16548 TaxID=3030994 RepID=UPI0025528F5E|nr:hypothetical protein [Microbispora sp. NBRC 16548]
MADIEEAVPPRANRRANVTDIPANRQAENPRSAGAVSSTHPSHSLNMSSHPTGTCSRRIRHRHAAVNAALTLNFYGMIPAMAYRGGGSRRGDRRRTSTPVVPEENKIAKVTTTFRDDEERRVLAAAKDIAARANLSDAEVVRRALNELVCKVDPRTGVPAHWDEAKNNQEELEIAS